MPENRAPSTFGTVHALELLPAIARPEVDQPARNDLKTFPLIQFSQPQETAFMKTVLTARRLAAASVISFGLIAMTPALAESQFTVGTTANLQASARLDFQVNIPRFISFQVGTAGAGTIDQVVFDVAAANIGNSSAVSPTSGAPVSVALRGNGGAINITADTTGTSLTNASADVIPFTQITSSTASGTITAPTLVQNGVSAAVAVPVSAGRVTDRVATWNYTYANTAVVGAGTYNGQVRYTATMP